MKAKLIKTDDGYHLKGLIKDVPKGINVYNKINDKECHFGFGTHSGKLSIKNCEAIELGYDLDEISKEETRKFLGYDVPENIMLFIAHSKMFQKGFQTALELVEHRLFKETEWQVEVVMDRIPADLAPGGWDVFPKLDAENCLILKRIK